MLIVDSQVHIWGANTPERPWPARAHAQRECDKAGLLVAVGVVPQHLHARHGREHRGERAREQLRAERVRLEHGESTPFDVLLREQDLVQAQSQKILAQNAYHNSITGLDRAQGTILERNQIVVEDAATLR